MRFVQYLDLNTSLYDQYLNEEDLSLRGGNEIDKEYTEQDINNTDILLIGKDSTDTKMKIDGKLNVKYNKLVIKECDNLVELSIPGINQITYVEIANLQNIQICDLNIVKCLSSFILNNVSNIKELNLCSLLYCEKLVIENCNQLDKLVIPSCDFIGSLHIKQNKQLKSLLINSYTLYKASIKDNNQLTSIKLYEVRCIDDLLIEGCNKDCIFDYDKLVTVRGLHIDNEKLKPANAFILT